MLRTPATRRAVLSGFGALVIAVALPPLRAHGATLGANTSEGATEVNAFVVLDTSGILTVLIPSSEMGQGVTTSLPQLVADELDADWSKVRVEHAPEAAAYRRKLGPGYTMMITGGSASVTHWGPIMREAGAAARAMIVGAAAARWDVDPATCTTEDSIVRHPSGREATYADLVEEARQRKPPRKVVLKSPDALRLIGRSVPRLDTRANVTGTNEFGIDVRLPGMLRACVVACPVFGGAVASVDDASAREIPGVTDVLVFDDFVAVVAETWWPARQAVAALAVQWAEGPNAAIDSEAISARLLAGVEPDTEGKPAIARKRGKALQRLAEQTDIDALYRVPYLDHAPMEPLNCTVRLSAHRCDIWTGTQVQTQVVDSAATITGLPKSAIHVHTTMLGGGFGRRGIQDTVEQALHIATRVDRPVQLLLTREEQLRHGFYRPAFTARMRARLENGIPDAIHIRTCGTNILHRYLPRFMYHTDMAQHFPLEGLLETSPYVFQHDQIDWVDAQLPIPTGFWRSVGHSHNAFFMESFLDEIAHGLDLDPVALRRALIPDTHPRFRACLDRAVEAAEWDRPREGRALGVALHESFGSICAQVAEVSMEAGQPQVHRVTAVVDCGPVVNPDIVRAQIMGGLIFGLSAAMGERLDLDRGRIVQSNFHDYPILRMADAPEVEVHIQDTTGAPVGGIGEIGTPPIAPAVCNAIFALTGKRIRSLPILAALREEEA